MHALKNFHNPSFTFKRFLLCDMFKESVYKCSHTGVHLKTEIWTTLFQAKHLVWTTSQTLDWHKKVLILIVLFSCLRRWVDVGYVFLPHSLITHCLDLFMDKWWNCSCVWFHWTDALLWWSAERRGNQNTILFLVLVMWRSGQHLYCSTVL